MREISSTPSKKQLNNSFEATPRSQIEHYVGMHVLYDQDKGILTLDARRHVYGFINHMGLDADSDIGVSTSLDLHEVYSKMDSPPEIDVKLRDKVWQAHCKLIHLAIWARPNLFHSVSVLGRYVHNLSEKLWNASSRIAKYLVKTRDLKLVYGTPDIELMDLEPYGHSDSDWGGCIDDRKSTGVYIFLLLRAPERNLPYHRGGWGWPLRGGGWGWGGGGGACGAGQRELATQHHAPLQRLNRC